MSEYGDIKNFCDNVILNIPNNLVGYQKRPDKCSNIGKSFISLDVTTLSESVTSQDAIFLAILYGQ